MTTKLVCPDCQHENESERIYCHDCGARLDRSGASSKNAPSQADTRSQAHLKRMLDPKRDRLKGTVRQLIKVLLGAAVCAALVLMALPPDLPSQKANYGFAPLINMDLITAISSRRPTPLVYSETDVNGYLASRLRPQNSANKGGYFPLRSVLVQFQEGQCAISVERQLFGFSIYSGCSYEVKVQDGKLAPRAMRGFVGRLPIAPSLSRLSAPLMEKAWTSLDQERKSVARLAGIEFHPQSVTLIAPH
jgi:hypothetical protein